MINYQEKKVLVTGAGGFIGSHLVEALVTSGAQVRALTHYNSRNDWGWLKGSAALPQIELEDGDIRDPFFCSKIVRDMDIIFNLAALIGIPYSYHAPHSYIETNVHGCLNICAAAVEAGGKRVIQISTSEVYGTAQFVPINEQHPLQPQSPYSASKIASDSLALSYFYSFDLPVVIARPFNTYGPRQSARAVIPSIITQILIGKREIMLGHTTPTRDFNYVTDTCRGLLLLGLCTEATGQVVNIGSNSEISIDSLTEMIARKMGVEVKIFIVAERERPEKSEVQRLVCDNSRIKSLTGFSPEINLEDGLQKTIQWLSQKENLNKFKPEIYNV